MANRCFRKAYTQRSISDKRSRLARLRSGTGLSLVEILVSLVVGSLIAFAMTDLFANVKRLSGTTQGEMYANLIIQELVENARASQYSFLNQYVGQQFTMLVNRDTVSQPSTPLRDDPLQLDLANLSWNNNTVASKFSGTVNYRIDQAPGLTNGLLLTVSVNWVDSAHSTNNGGNLGRTVTTSAIILQDGVNAWNP